MGRASRFQRDNRISFTLKRLTTALNLPDLVSTTPWIPIFGPYSRNLSTFHNSPKMNINDEMQ